MEVFPTRPLVNFDSFDLPFMAENPNDQAWDHDGERLLENYEVQEMMENTLPKGAIFLGVVEKEVVNYTSWDTNDQYYLIPQVGDGYEWALIRISWDDNWGRWRWCADARMSGISSQREAAIVICKALFKYWGYDIDKEENSAYRDFLEQI